MNTRHKYFRNQRYKKKLERLKSERCHSGSFGVMFITEGPDPQAVADSELHRPWVHIGKIKPDWEYDRIGNSNKFRYWDKPTIPYKITKVWYSACGIKKYYKKYSNRVVRRSKDIGQHSNYKKVFDLWWTID